MKVIIAGSRHFKEKDFMETIVAAKGYSDFDITEVVTGGAEGIDKAGERFAKLNGIPTTENKFIIPKWVWDYLGKKAGPLRNKAMAEYADALILIWDGKSRGSASMKREMQALKKPIYEVVLNG